MKRKRFTEEQMIAVLRELEQENARLKKIVADLTLDREMLQDVIKRKL
jgi:putative transposase